MLRKFQAKYSSDIKTIKTPRRIRHRTAKLDNEAGVASSMVLSMYQEIDNLTSCTTLQRTVLIQLQISC